MSALAAELSKGYLVWQLIFILCLYLLGALTAYAAGLGRVRSLIHALPAGLAVYCGTGFLLLCTGIPFNVYTVTGIMVLWGAGAVFLCISRIKGEGMAADRAFMLRGLAVVLLVFAAALLCVSNVLRVAIDNDSLYYFSTFPEALVKEGRYLKRFDVLLTDAGPVGAVLHTAPYIYGFSTTFGIQHAVNFSFLAAFFHELYTRMTAAGNAAAEAAGTERAGGWGRLTGPGGEKSRALVISALATAFLGTSGAYLTTAKWMMSGVYFMTYYCLLLFVLMPAAGTGRDAGCGDAGTGKDGGFASAGDGEDGSILKAGNALKAAGWILPGLYSLMCACMRQEGPVMLMILLILVSVYGWLRGRAVFLSSLLPALILSSLYYIRVFLILKVHPLYAFLTWRKALVLTAAMILTGAYLLFARDRLHDRGVLDLLKPGIPMLLVILNILLLIWDSSLYMANIKAFYANLRQREGWGFFPHIAFAFFIILAIRAVFRHERALSVTDSLLVTYILSVPVVSFGRGDPMRTGVGDSGNRVLLTAVPLIVFALVLRLVYAGKDAEKGAAEDD